MKAAIYKKFGPPEVLSVQEIQTPEPKENEVRIRIRATTVEKEDPGMRKNPGFNGLFKPRKPILGLEFAGEIESFGNRVTKFKVGDKVYGNTGMSFGTYAEYKCLPEDGAVTLMPNNMTFEEATAITNGALTALPFLRDKGQIKSGQKVLINGASGTVGSAAVQIAQYYGAEVYGVCSAERMDLVKSLGATKVIDYKNDDFTKLNEQFDIVFDVAGKSNFVKCKKILKPHGIFITTIPAPGVMIQILFTSISGTKKAKFLAAGMRSASKKAKDLIVIKEIVEAGKLKPVIDKTYTLDQIIDAHRYVEQGNKKGTVVVTV